MRIRRDPGVPKVVGIPRSEINFKKRVKWGEKKKESRKHRHKIAKMELEDAEHNTNLLEDKLAESIIEVSEKPPQKVEGGAGFIGEIIEVNEEERIEIPIWYVQSPLNADVFYLRIPHGDKWLRYANVKVDTIRKFFKSAGAVDFKV